MTKIDLAEIALIAESLRHREDEMIPKGWKAMKIATALEALPKLVAAIYETQQRVNDCDGNNFAGLFRTDYYECLLSEALTLFETTNPAKP